MSNDCLVNLERKHCPEQLSPFKILVPGHMQILAKVDAISGRAQPGAIVKIRVDNQGLEKTKANQNGYWRIPLECPLPPSCHVVFAMSSQAGEPSTRACFMVGRRMNFAPCNCHSCYNSGARQSDNVGGFHYAEDEQAQAEDLEAMRYDEEATESFKVEEGPELPPTPELLPAPEIFFPSHEQEINDSMPIVTGKAQANNMVIVCIRGMMCSRTMADDEGKFSVSFPRELTKGNYTVTALQADSRGNRSELTDHSFTVAL